MSLKFVSLKSSASKVVDVLMSKPSFLSKIAKVQGAWWCQAPTRTHILDKAFELPL